jgi:diguanylate cyclase (GGDEF)-like protein
VRTDELTGLHNRRGLTLYLQECRERAEGPPQALLLIDCDRFKQINDRHGHQAGDRVLQSMGNILRSMAGEQDLACRLGGDEFCLMLRRGNREIVQHAAEFILSAVHGLLERSHGTPHVSLVSIGASLLDADAGWSEWYASADRALYRAKRDGGNCLRWVDDPDGQ